MKRHRLGPPEPPQQMEYQKNTLVFGLLKRIGQKCVFVGGDIGHFTDLGRGKLEGFQVPSDAHVVVAVSPADPAESWPHTASQTFWGEPEKGHDL
eukprot:6478745-Amphidinium_carterae.1